MINSIIHGERPKKVPHVEPSPSAGPDIVGAKSKAALSWPQDLLALARKYPMEAVAQAFLEDTEPSALRQLIADELGFASKRTHDGHESLMYLASNGFIDRVYTTNFDILIEEGLAPRAVPIADENVDDVHQVYATGGIPVFHLHGSVNGKCLLEESRTYSLTTALAHFLKADMVTKWFVWVGYSLTDPDLRTMYLSMQEHLRKKELAKRPFVVHPLEAGADEERENEWRLANAVWNARYATYIVGTAEDFLPALVGQVRCLRATKYAEKVVRSRGGDPASQPELKRLWQQAEDMANKTGDGDAVNAMEMIFQEEVEE